MQRSVRDELAKTGPTFSFEFGPPRTDEAARTLWQTISELAPLHPNFVSVTYGAGGSTRDRTIDLTERISADTDLLPVAHLTAVEHSTDDLSRIVQRLAEVGIGDVLAVRGDPPGNPQGEWIARDDGLTYAGQLVRLIKSEGDFCVGVAAFPHRHPRSPDVESDTARFVEKCRAGADYAITQMFFEAEDYLRLRDRVQRAGGDIPILAGIMPVTNIATIQRSEALSGAPFPSQLAGQFHALADDPAALRELGIEEASKLCDRLLAEGVPGIHFITFNRSKAIREVWANLSAVDPVSVADGDPPFADSLADRWARVHPGHRADSSAALRRWLDLAWRVARPVAKAGVSPDLITILGAGLALGAAAAAALGGRPGLAVALVAIVLSAAADALDGAVAIIAGRVSARGARLDRAADRVSDTGWALVLWACGAPLWTAIVVAAGSIVQEGIRQRLGVSALGVITVAERPTRFICAALGLISALVAPHASWPAGICVAVWGAATLVAIGQLVACAVRARRGAQAS